MQTFRLDKISRQQTSLNILENLLEIVNVQKRSQIKNALCVPSTLVYLLMVSSEAV